jgi:hypothetical protein
MNKQDFLKDIDSWSNHRHILWQALEATHYADTPVLELGCGNGSTPYLQKYCRDRNRELISYDFNAEWAHKFGAVHVTNWDNIAWMAKYSVVLVDESPGEHRKESIKRLANNALILVVHDSEPIGHNASDYQVRPLFTDFNWMVDLKAEKPNAWATALSNFIDVSKFIV